MTEPRPRRISGVAGLVFDVCAIGFWLGVLVLAIIDDRGWFWTALALGWVALSVRMLLRNLRTRREASREVAGSSS